MRTIKPLAVTEAQHPAEPEIALLTVLSCDGNELSSLDVSSCTALAELDCDGNEITALDVSRCTALTRLDCEWNRLAALDLTENTKLTVLALSGNPGDGKSVFPVKAWFYDKDNHPADWSSEDWEVDDTTISPTYYTRYKP